MTQDAKPLTAEEIVLLRRHTNCRSSRPCLIGAKNECFDADDLDRPRLLATIDQQVAEIERLKVGADWLSRLTDGYIKYGSESAPLAYFYDTVFPDELANILAEARAAHEAAKGPSRLSHCLTHVEDYCNETCSYLCRCGHVNARHDTVGVCYDCDRRCGDMEAAQ